jgi:hypothetical protein
MLKHRSLTARLALFLMLAKVGGASKMLKHRPPTARLALFLMLRIESRRRLENAQASLSDCSACTIFDAAHRK